MCAQNSDSATECYETYMIFLLLQYRMTKIKIINDPVYGFIEVPTGLILSLIDHPWFQRLRRIRQGGFSNLVYPGAMHTRFHHALGAYNLATNAVAVLRKKGVEISDKEEEALQVALLLHDMGHGPFSHSLEGLLVPVEHEAITRMYLDVLNEQFDGKLSLAIAMFDGKYERRFFHQLISSELDLDRMDYLARDSFYTGVVEGVIGYNRIIHMLNVYKDDLVVEEKGINSIEKFLLARKLMYAQVYHHKMVVACEEMLRLFFERLHPYIQQGGELRPQPVVDFIKHVDSFEKNELLRRFSLLDDADILMLLKDLITSEEPTLRLVADGLINRRLFAMITSRDASWSDLPPSIRHYIDSLPSHMVRRGAVKAKTYSLERDEIRILRKSGVVSTYGKINEQKVHSKEIINYICFPKTASHTNKL